MDVLSRGDGWQRQLERIPIGRAVSDEEVAGRIAFLCSPAAGDDVHDRAIYQHRVPP